VKIVIDTNVSLAGLATHGFCERIVLLTFRDHTVACSEYILGEFAEHYVGKFKATKAQAIHVTTTLRSQCDIVEPLKVPDNACEDSNDLPVLGTVIAANADYLVTGDQALLQLGSYGDVAILSPRACYEVLHSKQ